ncbi:MAG TPA: AAA family ATPase [Candidatus Limnocylindrales bacterium]
MRIGRLQITDMRRYRDLDISLSPGLTIVRGPNEAGKTTIQRAIELVLTRKCTSSSADLDALRPWDAAEDSRPIIAIDFEQEDEEGIREGHLEKAFRGPKGYVRLDFNGASTSDPAQADEQLAELTGIPTEAFFRATASVRHHDVNNLAGEDGTLRDRLQASISGADRGTSRARRKLERALQDLNTRGPKNPGRLKVAEDAVAQSQSALDQGELALAQLERDRDSLVGARERRLEADRGLAEQRAMLEKARAAERLIADRDAAQERFERYRQAVAVRDEIATLQQNHPSADPLPVLRQIVFRLRALDGRIRELHALLTGEVSVKFEVTTPTATWLPIAAVAMLLILGGAAGAIASLLHVINVPPATVAGLAAIIAGIAIALFARRQRRHLLDFRRQKELQDVEIDRRLRGRSQLEEELRLADADTAKQLEMLGVADLAAAEERLTAEEEHVARIDVQTATLEGLIGKEPPESLPETRDAAALEVERKTHALEELGPIAREPRARERLEVAVRDAEGELERARDDEANARARVDANAVDSEQVAAHAERVAMWTEQLAALQRRSRVYDATLEAIKTAEQATMRTATHYLEKRMVVDLERITGGRYRRVRVDDKTLDIEVMSPEKGDWVPVTSLSQGTLDIVYLAARLGLVRLVTGDRRPPLVFDDPFVTLDDGRAMRALELLREVARDFQVIYLTTSDRYDAAADSVVELPAPTAADEIPNAERALVDA